MDMQKILKAFEPFKKMKERNDRRRKRVATRAAKVGGGW